MLAYYKYIGDNNKEDIVFPLENMYLTQGEGGSTSHQGSLAMDFIGCDSQGNRIYQCPYYAPCDLELVATPDINNHIYVYTSTNEVNFIDGTVSYFTIMFNHDNNIYEIGRTVSQGDIIGYTGTFGNGYAGGVADHVHIEAKRGQWEGLYQNLQGTWCMRNADHLFNQLGVNDTNLIMTGSYNWREFSVTPIPPTPPPTTQTKRFPWVLYARRLRNKRQGL